MEPESSSPPWSPTPELDQEVMLDEDLVDRFLSQVTETASGILDFSVQWKEYKEMLELMEESVRKQSLELQEKEQDSDLRQCLEAELLVLVIEMQMREVVAQVEEEQKLREDSLVKKHEGLKREFRVRKERLEAREKEVSLLDENIQEKARKLEKREEEFRLKQDGEAKDFEVKRKSLELKEKELSLLDEKIQEKFSELEKREDEFRLKQDEEAKDVEVKRKSLELKEKELEEREEVLERKEKELEERSKRAESRKRSRDEPEPSLFAENNIDDHSLFHTGKRQKPIREHHHYDPASASASARQAKGREVFEVTYIDDEDDEEDPEPYNCLDADFNNFNNTMSSFSVGQVWALYDTSDHMPRYYARIRKILQLQQKVEVIWLESRQTTRNKNPIACGEFKSGERTRKSHLTFSHLMHHIRTSNKTITINPRKGETWAIFRDWNKDRKRPYSYDFVRVVTEFDTDHGIGVAYLARVEGFTSVYELAEQNRVLQMMIKSDEMLRFSHRVPSFVLKGDEKEGVPPGSFELDPAAIPRDYLEASEVKQEERIQDMVLV